MSYDVPNPTDMNPAEKLVLRAMLTSRYSRGYGKPDSVTRPTADTLRYTFEGGVRKGSFRHFCYHDPNVVEWALMVANRLSDDRIPLANLRGVNITSLEESLAEARRVFETTFEAAKAEIQTDLDDVTTEEFQEWHRDAVVVDGKVVDPWGPALSGPVRWWFDNLSVNMAWVVHLVLDNAAQEVVAENLLSWASGDTSRDIGKTVSEKFEAGMAQLFKDIEEALKAAAVPEAA